MKCVILAGGRGTRIAEESQVRPKPMVEIGGLPILVHIMKIYAAHGIDEFIICLGYKGYVIKEYFYHYFLHRSDMSIDLATNDVRFHDTRSEPWKITLVDTGDHTQTGGRLKRIRKYLNDGEPFCMTYGDGVADIDVSAEIAFHHSHGLLGTMTLVRPPARFGTAQVEGDRIHAFDEKPQSSAGQINGGFFVLQPEALDYIDADETPWEGSPLKRIVADGQLGAWQHDGFWQAMDTLREKELLEALWEGGKAPWKVWE